ncbi:thioredoxin [Buchnera aphidicola (Schlechtendalia chinensis)]|uniref:Thioredoxin n=1 Tax=Buchnera aphidicola subsp. Schlechtendalia chinensis TaxID=118110 RepID=A0A172WEB7_BUCSC|nr:thioredoxin TrxA [Buchnera aphidicola]ANF17282.1 thioredoxin [Buchnera aphidicola (Schlechtendalia chinensis)]
MKGNIIDLTDNSFEKCVLESQNTILVDFWADWCNPCKILAPILEEISIEYSHLLTVMKINIDSNPNTAPKYSIRGIPALLLFKSGELIATKIGALSKMQLKNFLDINLK